ncbi:MAG: maltose ABC transporter substrate-binding protein [Clostridia bacterium]|nr:maltose ABC transporter substrate-binding protein [Clostridia bacterium]
MKKYLKLLSTGVATLVLVTTLFGCGSGGSKGSEQNGLEKTDGKTVENKDPKEIVVWSHLQEKSEVPEVKRLAEEWAQKTGNTVKVMFDQRNFQTYTQAATSSKGPDIMFGMPHNDLGVFQKADLLAEVPGNLIDKSKYVDVAITAVTHGGKMYALPLAMDAMALFYNTDMVQTPPETFDEFIEQAKKVGFMYNIADLYSSYAFLAGNGAYVFKNTDGTYDISDIGLGNEGAVKGYDLLGKFVREYKFMGADCTGDIARGNFQSGKIGFLLGGPWDVDGFNKNGVKFAVCPLPKLNGKIMPTFVGIQAAFVSSKSKNQDEAWDLMKYLAENSPMPLLKTGNRIPVLKAELEKPEVKENKTMQAFSEQSRNGDPIPNVPETNSAWDPVKNNISLVLTGKIVPEKAAEDVVKQIKEGIALQN